MTTYFPADGFYVTGGTLPRNAACYVSRNADEDLMEGLRAGQFCYVLTSRQMGKSSLMVRTAMRLREEGVTCVVLDLTAIGQNLDANRWYSGMLNQLGQQVGLEDELDAFWLASASLGPMQCWMQALQQVVLSATAGNIVIFVDEIDAVRSLPFSADEFFAAIRACYNRRTVIPEFARLAFCLLGVATPSDLIRDVRSTPFNIGRRIELTDFTAREAAVLGQGFDPGGGNRREGQRLIERVLYWTGGHPYLTQRLCAAVAADFEAGQTALQAVRPTTASVDAHCAELFLTSTARARDDNLVFVRERLQRSETDVTSLLDLYSKVLAGRRVANDETNQLTSVLLLSGIVRAADGLLVIRNRIYRHNFNRAWALACMPDADLQRQRIAYRRGVFRTATVAGVVVAAMAALIAALLLREQADHKVDLAFQDKIAADRKANLATRNENAVRAQMQRLQADLKQTQGDNRHARATLLSLHSRIEKGNRQLIATTRERQEMEGLLAEAKHTLRQTRELQRQRLKTAHENAARAEANAHAAQQRATGALADAQAAQQQADEARQQARKAIQQAQNAKTKADLAQAAETTAEAAAAAALAAKQHAIAAQMFADQEKARAQTAAQQALDATKQALAAVSRADYITAMKLAQRDWENDDYGHLRATLEETKIYPERGFEWYYWRQHFTRWLNELRLNTSVHTVAVSPDGRKIAAGSEDGVVTLWDAATNRQLLSLPAHGSYVSTLAFTPDGRNLVTGGVDDLAKVWDVATGHLLHTHSISQYITALACAPNNKQIAIGTGDGKVTLRALADDTLTLTLSAHANMISSLAYAPNGKLLVVGSHDGAVSVWNVMTGRKVRSTQIHAGWINAVAWSHDNQTIITGSEEGNLTAWDPGTGSLKKVLTKRGPAIRSLAFAPDQRHLVTGEGVNVVTGEGDNNVAQIWELGSGNRLRTLKGHRGEIAAVAYMPDGKRIVTGSLDHTVKIWNAQSGDEPAVLRGHSEQVNAVAFLRDSKHLITGSFDGTAKLWDIHDTRTPVRTFRVDRERITSVACSPDGRHIVIGSYDKAAWIWNLADDAPPAPLRPREANAGWVNAVAYSPDGKWIVTGSSDKAARIWNADTGKLWQTLRPTDTNDDAHLQTIEAADGETNPQGQKGALSSVAFAPDGQFVVIGSYDYTARIWNVQTGMCVRTLRGYHGSVNAVAYSPDGKLIVTGGYDTKLRVWNSATGDQPLLTLKGHRDQVVSVAFSPDGRRLISGSYDGTVRVWETGTWRELLVLQGPKAWGSSVAISDDGTRIACGSADSTATLWDAPTNPAEPQ